MWFHLGSGLMSAFVHRVWLFWTVQNIGHPPVGGIEPSSTLKLCGGDLISLVRLYVAGTFMAEPFPDEAAGG